MAAKKYYGASSEYENKLKRVMDRLGVTEYRYDWNRQETYVEFQYKGQWYHFDNNFSKAEQAYEKTRKHIVYVSDLFAQIVLALEDLARLSEQGLYELSYWIEGMKMLPQAPNIPACFGALGFDHVPDSEEELKQRFRQLAKVSHPDGGGSAEQFQVLKRNYLECQNYMLDHGADEPQ